MSEKWTFEGAGGLRASAHAPPSLRQPGVHSRRARPRPFALQAWLGSLVLVSALEAGPAEAATFGVNSTGDAADAVPGDGFCATGGGVCTLRAAIGEANALAGVDTINFNIGAGGVQTITLTGALPFISQPVTIDGTTQPLYPGTPIIELSAVAGGAFGALDLRGGSSGSTIRGLVINGCPSRAIRLLGTSNNVIAGNFLGTNVAGTAAVANNTGVYIGGSATATNNNRVGGTAAADRNVISGNTADGVQINGGAGGAANNRIEGNYIGLDVSGTLDLGNGGQGVAVFGANTNTNNVVGGTALDAGNVISGNGNDGVLIANAGTTGTRVEGNRIGTNAAGTAAIPNLRGVEFDASANGNTIGGTVAGAANRIAYNVNGGVEFTPTAGTGNPVLSNEIYSNGTLGIDLGENGVTANDPGDGDSGPNAMLNFPDITAASVSGGSVSVSFLLDVPGPAWYRVEFFKNPTGGDPLGYGEGHTLVGARNVNHPGGGAVAFTHNIPGAGGDVVTATTTLCTDGATCAAFGSTSEFSATELVACCSLSTTTASGTISVTAASAFKLVFDEAAGGHPTQFYDLTESPIEDAVHDLAGGITVQDGLFLDELTLQSDGVNYRSDKGPGANASVLEATATRTLVRSESYFGRPASANRMAGIRAVGDWSVQASGRMALHWERRTTSAVNTTFQQLHLNLHQQGVAPLNGWAGFTQGGALCLIGCPGPAGTDFVLLQIEQAGARTDFLKILYQDWPGSMESWGSGNLPQEWTEASWNRNAVDTIPANTTDAWNFLTYFKPTTFANEADSAVITRAADYRGPDDLATPVAPVAGTGWFDAAESTVSPADFFNEKEAAYTLDLDPIAGLNFDMDGAANPRYHPFFKIRQWRGLTMPATITLEGVTLNRNVGFKADPMPISRASMHQDLLWYSTLQDAAAVTSPDVGSGGSLSGTVTYEAARFGSGARLDASGDSIQVPTSGNFDKARGRIGFWYRPDYDNTDGVHHDLLGFFTDANNYWFLEKRTDNNLYFRIRAGGAADAEVQVTSANYSWRANEWVHLRISWDDTLPLSTQQRLHINDLEPLHANPTVDYNSAALVVAGQLRFGNTDGDATFAPGVYDEIDIISATTVLANAGLVGTASEYLADPAPAKNLPLNFAGVDAQGRGRYLYLSTTAKFRGLNIGLATPGAGVAAGALEWEYWDGSGWASLESVGGFIDQTNSLTRSGSVFWTADPPGWVPYSLSGGLEIFRIRVHLALGSTYSSPPVEGLIRPDILLLQYCGEVRLDAQTFVINPPAPTAVRLQSFAAVAGDASVVLEWRTASELDNLGFHVYRSQSESGPWARLTPSLIPGLGSSAVGQAYSFRDTGLANGTRYFYRLDDVDGASKTTSHGPVSAVPLAAAAAGDGADDVAGSTTGNARDRKKGAGSSTCPDWVLAAYGSSVGSDAATASLRCSRHGDPEAVSLGVVSRDSRSATLELKTGGFYALHEPSGTVRVFVPGFDFPRDEKAAGLPIRRALVDAVVGRRVQLGGVRALDVVSFKRLVPSALGKAEMQVGRDGTVRAARRGSPAPLARLPKLELVTLLPSVFQGEAKSAVVEIAPLRFDAQRQQLVLAKRVLVKLLFTGREAGESGRGKFGRAARSSRTVSGEVLARLYTTNRGLHSASFEQLFPGRPRGLAASQLRLERQGEAVGFHVEPASDSFGPGSRLYFFADRSAGSADFSSEVAYELVRSREGVRMPLVAAAPARDAIGAVSTAFAAFEANRFYQPGLLDAEDLWQWEGLPSGTTRVKSFSLGAMAAAASQTAELDVSLQGASESGQAIDHHVSVSVNGVLAGEAQFAGKRPYRMSLSVAASLLREGANELSLTNVADTGVTSYVFLDRFSLAHPQASALAGGHFEGEWPESGSVSLSAPGAVFGPVSVVDVTDGRAKGISAGAGMPAWLTGHEGAAGAVRFRVEAGHRYWVGSDSALFSPRIVQARPSELKSAVNQADYLLIAPRAFLATAEPLLERRSDQGLATRAVAFEEIADEFGHGEPSAEAIKSFLSFAFHSWARPSPRYVLLLGDSTYDPRNFIGTSQPSPLPALWTKTSYLWTVSDPQLAAVNGDDELPDLAIGRLPATTVEEAQKRVEKLLAWEDSGQSLSGQAALVADNPDLAGDFEANVRDIAQSFLPGRSRLLLLSELGAGTRPAIQDALNSGLSLLSYVGHGGAAVWASENVWNSWDAPSLQAQSQQPLLVTMNCLNGYFVAPAFDSLSESLLKAEGRGAIAAFSPSGLSLDGPAHQYHRALMAELTSGRHERLGDAILAAQRAYLQTGLMPELLGVYHLLGDPAMRVRP